MWAELSSIPSWEEGDHSDLMLHRSRTRSLDLPGVLAPLPPTVLVLVVLVSESAASSGEPSLCFFLNRLRRPFFRRAGSGLLCSELCLDSDDGGDLPLGVVSFADESSTPKTRNASAHSSRSLTSCSGVRLPGRPGGMVLAAMAFDSSLSSSASSSDEVVSRLDGRSMPIVSPIEAPTAKQSTKAVDQLAPPRRTSCLEFD
jgi:hypothetical protein